MSDFSQQRPVIFGEVLFDRFPDGSVVLGGAPFNVAWHLQAFGVAPLFISRVGNDASGRAIRDTMHAWEMDTSGLQLDSAHPTGSVDITIEDGEADFDIVDNQAYDFIDPADVPPLPDCALLYHGSLAVRNPGSGQALQQLQRGRDLRRLVDVNLRPPWWQRGTVMSLLQGAEWIKLNEAELALLATDANTLEEQVQQLQENCKAGLLIITRGSAGALVFTSAGEKFGIQPQGDSEVIDTVGAGDAFTSVVVLGLLRGWNVQQTLEHAQAFASAITGIRGATRNDPGFYQPFIEDWKLI